MGCNRRYLQWTVALVAAVLFSGAGISHAQIPVQIINSSPDPAMAVVDVYVDGALVADNLTFKGATPFIDQFGVPVIIVTPTSTIDVADAASVDNSTPLVSTTLGLTGGVPTLIEILGLVVPANFPANPDGRSTALQLVVVEGYKPAAANPLSAELMAVHASPDLGGVDLLVRVQHNVPGVGIPLYTNLRYGDSQPYLPLSPSVAVLDLVETGTTNVVETWVATFGLVVGAGVVGHVADFTTPGLGAGLTLFGAVASGFVFELAVSSATAVGDVPNQRNYELRKNYPNPFNPTTVIPFSLKTDQPVKLQVYDLQGRLVRTLVDRSMSAGDYEIPFHGTALASGTYLYRLDIGGSSSSEFMTLLK